MLHDINTTSALIPPAGHDPTRECCCCPNEIGHCTNTTPEGEPLCRECTIQVTLLQRADTLASLCEVSRQEVLLAHLINATASGLEDVTVAILERRRRDLY